MQYCCITSSPNLVTSTPLETILKSSLAPLELHLEILRPHFINSQSLLRTVEWDYIKSDKYWRHDAYYEERSDTKDRGNEIDY